MRICFLSQSYGPNGTFMVTHSDVVLIIVTHLQYWNYLPTDCPRNYLQTCLQIYLQTCLQIYLQTYRPTYLLPHCAAREKLCLQCYGRICRA